MTLNCISNSKVAAGNVALFGPSEGIDESCSGIYIGKTAIYKLPFFLDTAKLLNPHMVAVGMTGSGKTYFMKSYLIKSRLATGCGILVLDWNGEYDDLVGFLDGNVVRVTGNTMPDLKIDDGVTGINLSGITNDRKRNAAASAIVDNVITFMHNMPIDARKKRIFLIDEAWRALGKENNLGQLFREGRKYGFCIMTSTQLVSDINNEVLANAGAVFIFRIQNAEDRSTLSDSGITSTHCWDLVPGLGVGNCVVRLAYKEKATMPQEIMISKIDGVSASVCTLIGGKMQIKIHESRFVEVTREIIRDPEVERKIAAYVEANDRSMDISGMMALLAKNGICRGNIVTYFRAIGFDDLTIVKEYESLKQIVIQ